MEAKNYPQVFYPEFIEQFCRQYPFPKSPTDPNEQNEETELPNESMLAAKEPPFPKQKVAVLTRRLWEIWLWWLVGIVAGILLGVAFGLPFLAILSLTGAYCCSMAALYVWVRADYARVRGRYQLQLAEYKRKRLEERSAVAAKKSKETTKSRLGEPESERYSLEQRLKVLRELLRDRVQPIGISTAKQGISERQFGEYLQIYFEDVMQGAEFETGKKWNYSADFLVWHPASGLGLDIEIDEPYVLLTKEPTHCSDRRGDRRRNQFFSHGGWIVVRFTERQVVEAPLSCCKAIAQVIVEVTGDRRYWNQLESIANLLPQRPWTVAEAKRMARNNYRLSYLKEEVRGVLRRKKGSLSILQKPKRGKK
jgi:hypothetical protein